MILAAGLHAGEAQGADWSGEVDGGAVRTSGNIETQSLNAHGKLAVRYGPWKQTLRGNALNTQNQGATTGERYRLSLKTNYHLTERSYLFGRIGYVNDRFTGYRSRTTETTGYGRDLIQNERFHWNLELGGGARQDRLVDGTRRQSAILRGATHAAWRISDSTKLKQMISEDGGADGWVTHSVTSLQSRIYGNLSSKIYFRFTNTSKVPAGRKKLDTETGVNLVYSFDTTPESASD
jgi:putative salt-induced outer membrane protein